MELPEIFEENRTRMLLSLAGLFLLAVGVLSVVVVSLRQSEPEVEILSADESKEEGGEIVVDVEGAVENPGIYKLETEARVNDGLVAAGGMSANADREWISKNVNLAQILTDGVKIYIPYKGEYDVGQSDAVVVSVGSTSNQGEVIGVSVEGKININTASVSELDSLWGIGAARSAAIIENRPFSSTNELLDKKIIPSNVFERIKDEITI